MAASSWAGDPAAQPGSCFVGHNDFARFAVPERDAELDRSAHPGATLYPQHRPDEFWIDPTVPPRPAIIGWERITEFALGSAAFPVGLAPRQLSRPWEHLLYRPVVDAGGRQGPTLCWPEPDWDLLGANQAGYDFTSVDGGMFNNDPIGMAHTWMAGMTGHHPRDPKLADRALLLIDPLASQTDDSCAADIAKTDMTDILTPILNSTLNGARYTTSDLMLMADPAVFSRFQLVPLDPANRRAGDRAIVSSRLMGFAGFFSRDFRARDFMLGRVNMQAFLRKEFVLHQKNALFDKWSQADRQRWAVDNNGVRVNDIGGLTDYYLPIIPDLTFTANQTDIDAGLPWSKAQLPAQCRLAASTELLKTRLQAVLDNVRRNKLPGLLGWLLQLAVSGSISQSMADNIVAMLKTELGAMGIQTES
jgi:hypothetical protein